ncbi:hypothetical protein BH11MYX3_BH11MYX3_37420 [soil metagenome]
MRTRWLAAVILLASGTAGAWVAQPDREAPEVGVPGRQPRADRTLSPARGLPGGWQGTRDRDTGVVAELWGSYVAAPGAVADPVLAEQAARSFVFAQAALLAPGVQLADLVVAANHLDRGLRTVTFRQTWRGSPVIGGQLAVMIRSDRVFAATSQVLPDVTLDVPVRTAVVSTRRAEAWLGGKVVTRTIGPRVVLPLINARGALEYRVADQLEIEATDRAGRWDVYVGLDGQPMLRSSLLRFATGTLTYDVGVRYPLGPRHDVGASQANITADGTATTTATDGSFSWTGTSAASVAPGLTGPRITVNNAAGSVATAALTAQPGAAVRWSLAADEYGDAQLSAFVNVGIAKVRARVLMPSIASWLDESLAVTVNENDICNAYSTGDDIHFFRAGSTCENTGRLADVVDHELGHSVHKHSIIPGAGAFNAALSEGVSDFFSATIVGDHALGRGFGFNNNPVRDLDPDGKEAMWPRDKSADPHITGLIIGGALWDLRTALIAELGEPAGLAQTDAIFAGILQRAPDVVGGFLAAQLADDDDGNLGNGTPHFCAIETAFGKHGLAGPSFLSTQVGRPVFDGSAFTVPTTTPTGTPCPVPLVTKVELQYHDSSGVTGTVGFTPSGTTWVGGFPTTLTPNRVVYYRIVATLDDGALIIYPDNPADPEYQMFTGTLAEIWCERMDTDPKWTASGTSWQWAPPSPLSVSGDPTVTHTGTGVLGTEITGNGRYPSGATTSITMPEVETWMYDEVHLQYWRWLTVEDALYDQATISVNGTGVWANPSTTDGSLDQIDHEWRFQDLDVTALAGHSVQAQWSITSDMSRELGGWTIDDVCLVGLGKHPVCGDGVIDAHEDCDDGNTEGGDGCSQYCRDDDGGGCCSAGTEPSGPLLLGLGVLAVVARRRRRR